MLPCQKTCPSYREGCHKTCANWLLFQRRQKEQREAKKAYLRYHMEHEQDEKVIAALHDALGALHSR